MSVSAIEREQESNHTSNDGKSRSSSLPIGDDELDGGAVPTAKEAFLYSPGEKEGCQSEVDPIEGKGEKDSLTCVTAVQSQAISSSAGSCCSHSKLVKQAI